MESGDARETVTAGTPAAGGTSVLRYATGAGTANAQENAIRTTTGGGTAAVQGSVPEGKAEPGTVIVTGAGTGRSTGRTASGPIGATRGTKTGPAIGTFLQLGTSGTEGAATDPVREMKIAAPEAETVALQRETAAPRR